jgi:hypothetical protein
MVSGLDEFDLRSVGRHSVLLSAQALLCNHQQQIDACAGVRRARTRDRGVARCVCMSRAQTVYVVTRFYSLDQAREASLFPLIFLT